MMQLIHCRHCDKTGSLPVRISFEYSRKHCDHCHHTKSNEWKYFFCNQECMFDWLKKNEIEEKGFPCESCRQSGWFSGFEENGVCPVCEGETRVKK